MKDFLGNELNIGDKVVFDYCEFICGEIILISDSDVLVKYHDTLWDQYKKRIIQADKLIKYKESVPVKRKKRFRFFIGYN